MCHQRAQRAHNFRPAVLPGLPSTHAPAGGKRAQDSFLGSAAAAGTGVEFAYRGSKQGAYAPSQFWSGKEPPARAVPQSANVPQPTYVVPQTGNGTPQPGYYSPSQQRPVAAPAASAPYPQPPSQQQPPLTQANVSPAQSQPPAMPPSQGPAPIRMIDGQRVVEVRQGDTLFSIAKQNRVSDVCAHVGQPAVERAASCQGSNWCFRAVDRRVDRLAFEPRRGGARSATPEPRRPRLATDTAARSRRRRNQDRRCAA